MPRHSIRQTELDLKLEEIDYNPEKLNAPKENWYALFICIYSNYSVDKALSAMRLRENKRRR